MNFESEFFQKFNFQEEQISNYLKSAEKNLRIAENIKIPEVIFKFSYDAMIKIGITLIARNGYKVKTRLGHHIKILEALGSILKDKEIEAIGNIIRKQRNVDIYGEGAIVSKKQSEEYLEFIQKVFRKAKKYFNEY